MSSPESESPYFLGLCAVERQPPLAEICAGSGQRVVFVDDIGELLKHAIRQPPLALILEIATVVRCGAERMSKFLNLGVSWPVMRCSLQPDGEARIMCFEPAHGEPLLTALSAIAADDPSWRHPRFRRRHLRLNLPGRVRLRTTSEGPWRHGNLQGISCGGCFAIMTSDAPPVGAAVELELVDFVPASLPLRGKVAWTRPWEAGIELPGIGVEFDPTSVGDDFRGFLCRNPQLNDLIEL
jgi:hypothetical protein